MLISVCFEKHGEPVSAFNNSFDDQKTDKTISKLSVLVFVKLILLQIRQAMIANVFLLFHDVSCQFQCDIKMPCIVLSTLCLPVFVSGIPFGCVKQITARKEGVQI